MGSATMILGPVSRTDVVDLGRNVFRKQVLPKGTIKYKGRTLSFDDKYLTDLATAFKQNAFDQNAFQLSDGKQEHTTDPERFRGEVLGYEVTPKGLDAIFKLTDEGAALVRTNPKLGVSPRIIEGLEHADGRVFPRAIHHIAGTLDPRNTGMEEWQEVSLANEVNKDQIDLSEEEVIPEDEVDEDDTSTEDDDDEDEDDDDSDEDEDDVEMSGEGRQTLDFLRAADNENKSRIEDLEIQLAKQRFENEAHQFIEDGVPPALVELARPILELPAAPVIDLSREGEEVPEIDVADVVRKLLTEAKGYVELSRELGHSFTKESGKDPEQAVLDAWSKQSGGL